jgi:hypothetical protein
MAGGFATVNVAGGQPGATCYVLQSATMATPVANWAPVVVRTFDSNGNGAFPVALNGAQPQMFFALRTVISPPVAGAMTYSLAGGWEGWPADARARIVYAMDGAVAQYNRYGTFNKHVTVNYNPGVPTAQANYDGWLEFGANPSYQQYRTALHEVSHTLGVGTYWSWSNFRSGNTWTGTYGVQQVREFDGAGAGVGADAMHFWPYGLNFDNEGGTENFRRHVFMVAAFRRDMGIQ